MEWAIGWLQGEELDGTGPFPVFLCNSLRQGISWCRTVPTDISITVVSFGDPGRASTHQISPQPPPLAAIKMRISDDQGVQQSSPAIQKFGAQRRFGERSFSIPLYLETVSGL